ncbi:MAG: hypothetical protein ABI607_10845 [Betaproteobacteria bacterium]
MARTIDPHQARAAPCGTVAPIAKDVGYESEAAFAHTFKRTVGNSATGV